MSKYVTLRHNPPKWKVCENPKEVIFHTISCMCDNKNTIRFKKNQEGEFKMDGMGYALSNWQFKHHVYEIEWAADEGNWLDVYLMINSGTSVIESIKSR